MVNTINFSQVFKMCIPKNCRPCQENVCLTLLTFCMRNIHFCHLTEGLELNARLNILHKSVVYQSVKWINQKWGLWKIERTHYSNALSPCLCICCCFCIKVHLLYCLFSSLIIDVNVRHTLCHISKIIPTIIGLNIWIEKVILKLKHALVLLI